MATKRLDIFQQTLAHTIIVANISLKIVNGKNYFNCFMVAILNSLAMMFLKRLIICLNQLHQPKAGKTVLNFDFL